MRKIQFSLGSFWESVNNSNLMPLIEGSKVVISILRYLLCSVVSGCQRPDGSCIYGAHNLCNALLNTNATSLIMCSVCRSPLCCLFPCLRHSCAGTGMFSDNNVNIIPDSKVHGANMGPTEGRQDPGGPHAGPVNLAIWDGSLWDMVQYVLTHT